MHETGKLVLTFNPKTGFALSQSICVWDNAWQLADRLKNILGNTLMKIGNRSSG